MDREADGDDEWDARAGPGEEMSERALRRGRLEPNGAGHNGLEAHQPADEDVDADQQDDHANDGADGSADHLLEWLSL